MRPFEIGLVLPLWDSFEDGSTSRWVEIRDLALRAEDAEGMARQAEALKKIEGDEGTFWRYA